jgi:hypothetical protein
MSYKVRVFGLFTLSRLLSLPQKSKGSNCIYFTIGIRKLSIGINADLIIIVLIFLLVFNINTEFTIVYICVFKYSDKLDLSNRIKAEVTSTYKLKFCRFETISKFYVFLVVRKLISRNLVVNRMSAFLKA